MWGAYREPFDARYRRAAMHGRIPAVALIGVFVIGCAGAGAVATPSALPSPQVTPTPVPGQVISEQDAAARVLLTNPLFAGATRLNPDTIGASKWWESKPLAGGGWQVTVTVGWGDCPAGCISKHTWTYTVKPDGAVSLDAESGPPVPSGGELPA
jgi:hypothetical protein